MGEAYLYAPLRQAADHRHRPSQNLQTIDDS